MHRLLFSPIGLNGYSRSGVRTETEPGGGYSLPFEFSLAPFRRLLLVLALSNEVTDVLVVGVAGADGFLKLLGLEVGPPRPSCSTRRWSCPPRSRSRLVESTRCSGPGPPAPRGGWGGRL